MRFATNPGVTETEVVDFESQIGFPLPPAYRVFLRRCNGGAFQAGHLELPVDVVGPVYLHCLFGVGLPSRALDLLFWHHEMSEELPPQSLLIGNDPGGAFLLLSCDGDQERLYLFDHAHRYRTSSDARNSYPIAEDLGNLLNRINELSSI